MSYKFNDIDQNMGFGFDIERISRNECYFHAIYFLDNLTGSLLVSKKYSEYLNSPSNGDLISGFLTALNLFIKEIKPGDTDEEIQEINFKETRILYERRGRLTVIAITKKSTIQFERHILNLIVDDFYNRFGRSINHFNGLIEPTILDYKKKLKVLSLYNSDFEK